MEGSPHDRYRYRADREALGDRPLYICGEAYSDAQGWVEGALQTADMVLDQLGLPALAAP